LGSTEFLRYALKKRYGNKTEKKKNYKSHKSLRKTQFTRLDS